MARPRIVIPWEDVEELCAIFCTLEEISTFTKISEDTLERACHREKGVGFADFWKKHSARGKISLRRQQFRLAEMGDRVMLIWLGKQYLGQRDNIQDDNKDAMVERMTVLMAEIAKELKERDG